MLQVCDTNLFSFYGTAGAGTYGEAQISALKNQQVFIWLNKGLKMSNISPWLFPSITKIYVFSEGPVSVSTSFSLAGEGLNWDTHIYDRYGANGVKFTGPESNGTNIKIESNGVKLVSNGIGLAEII